MPHSNTEKDEILSRNHLHSLCLCTESSLKDGCTIKKLQLILPLQSNLNVLKNSQQNLRKHLAKQ